MIVLPVTYKLISTLTVSTATQAALEFTNIPGTFDDLILKISLRGSNSTQDYINLQFNSSTSNFNSRWILGNGSAASSGNRSDSLHSATLNQGNFTASTFSNAEIYIPNYAGSTNKSFSIDTVTENNSTTANMEVIAALWSNTSAITSIKMIPGDGTGSFVQYSTAVLYGIKKS